MTSSASAPVVMMTSSSSSSLSRRHTDLQSPVTYSPSTLSAFLQSSTSADYRRHNYQPISSEYLPPRVTSASSGLHGDVMTHHLQQQQQVQRSPSFAIHELLGLHGPMMPAACPGSTSLMFDCNTAAVGAGYNAAAVTGSNYRQQTQFFPATYHSSAPAPPSTPLSMPDVDPLPVQPPPLLPGPPSCHRATTSSWPPSTSPTSHVSELTTARVHRPTTYRDAYHVLQRNFKPAFGPTRSISHKYATHYRTYNNTNYVDACITF